MAVLRSRREQLPIRQTAGSRVTHKPPAFVHQQHAGCASSHTSTVFGGIVRLLVLTSTSRCCHRRCSKAIGAQGTSCLLAALQNHRVSFVSIKALISPVAIEASNDDHRNERQQAKCCCPACDCERAHARGCCDWCQRPSLQAMRSVSIRAKLRSRLQHRGRHFLNPHQDHTLLHILVQKAWLLD